MLLFAFTGTMKADVVTIGDPTSTTTNSYIPTYSLYEKSYTQQIYTADEIGMAGTINSLTMWLRNTSSYARNLNIYMKETDKAEFSVGNEWIPMTDADLVASVVLDVVSDVTEMTFELSTPFAYSGAQNLVISIQDVTGSWSGGAAGVVMTTEVKQAVYAYRDVTTYDPANPGVTGTTITSKNVIALDITGGGGGAIVEADLTVYDGEATNGYVPVYGFYADAYLKCEMVYPAEVLADMNGGAINSLKFYAQQASVDWGAEFEVFVNEVADASISSFVGDGTIVYHSGALSIVDGEMVVNFETPYTYNGGNLLVGVYETTTGSYVTSTWLGETVTGASVQGYSYSSLSSITATQRNFLPKTTFHYTKEEAPLGPGFHVLPAEIGYRPIGAWMEPTTVELAYSGEPVTVNGFDTENGNFTVNAEVPFTLNGTTQTKAIGMEINATTPGLVEDNLVVLYAGRNMALTPVSGIAYEPEDGDVCEKAIVLDATTLPFSFSGQPTGTMYHNYNLLNAEDGAVDAVYKMTFDQDVLFTANTTDGVVYLYEEGFQGEQGPKDNNYYYNEISGLGGNNSFTEDFEGGLNGWNVLTVNAGEGEWLHSDENPGGYDYTAVAHGGTGFAMCYSYVDYVGSFDTDSYLYTPVKYSIEAGSTLNFWADNANDSYPEYFSVCVATADNPTAADFVEVWSGSAKGTANGGDKVRHQNNRYNNWRSHSIDLSAYAGQEVYIAFHDVNYDMYEVWIDDVELTVESTEGVAYNQMLVPAGTYYVVYSGTNNVNIQVVAKPAPAEVVYIRPFDGQANYETSWTAQWQLDVFTTEMQVLFGTTYPPTILVDWTDELVSTMTLPGLQNNRSYFLQVNQRNENGTTNGQIIAFTTSIDPVEGLAVEETNLYPGDAAALTWTANARTLKGYNVYVDGVKWNESLINTNSYDVEGLEYNMAGYNITVTSVYDAGESEPSEAVTVFMTGNGSVSGHAYDKPDEDTDAMPIAFATVMFSGSDEYGVNQTFVVEADAEGAFSGEILAGAYSAFVITEGYDSSITVNATVNYDALTDEIDIYTHEFYYPVGQVTATDEGNDVLVEWSWNPAELIIDFETGDFSQAEFTLPAQYPWTVTTTNPYEGTYCMKSTCEGQASATSSIEVTAEVPYDGLMGFWVRVSSEQNYDKFHFYIDGVEMGAALSGEAPYSYKEYAVTEGTHTYKFEYTKDSSVNSNDDCIYVDNITMYKQAGPAPSGMAYNFDDNTMMGWTSLDADGDGNGWVSSANPGIYHNSGVSLSGTGHNDSEAYVISGSYANQTYQALTPDNYLVSPFKMAAQNGAAINFWACAQDASYAAEHFGVAVSTGSNTSAADFTTVQEWTMTAKNGRGADEYSAVRGTRQGSWYQYTVDLSAYAGQEIWVAIRHFNCTDMFILNVDDITLGDGTEAMAPRNDRTFQSFNVYRRNNIDPESVADPELIVEGTTDFEYTDAAWETLGFGEWQWGVAATYAGYAPVPEATREDINVGFEDGMPEGWTVLDGNNDGWTWCMTSDIPSTWTYYASMSLDWYRSGTNAICSGSYINGVGALTPNEFLITNQITPSATSTFSFYAAATDASYPADHFGVAVSTTGTAASDFTMLQEWTLTAKSGAANGGRESRDGDGAKLGTWYNYSVDLGAYAGQNIYVAIRHFNCNDQYIMCVDDITITGVGGAPVPPTPGPTGSGISEIIWSNVIEKDMEATLTFNVSLNNGQSPEGAAIAVVGEHNTYNETVGETGAVAMVVRKGDTYDITVSMDGYASWNPSGNPIFVEADATYTVVLNEVVGPVDGLYVSPTGWAMWEGTTAGGVTPPTPPTPGEGDEFEVGFEEGMPEGWTIVDANNDGYTWCMTSNIPSTWTYYASLTLDWYRTGTNAICSGSYINGAGALNPDEFLVTPQVSIVNGSTFSFWAAATDASYPADHFGVFVSDDATNWTSVQEWTLTAKSGAANGGRASRDAKGDRLGTWYNYSVDLSEYAGQKYIAIRHFNCYDQYIMCVDDIELTNGSKGNRAPISYKVMLDGTYVGESQYPFYQHDVEGMEEGSTHITAVAPLFASGMGDWETYTWTYTSCSNFAGVTDFTSSVVDRTVTLNWTLPGGGSGGGASTFTEGFEGGMPDGWTIVDANNDGYTWCMTSNIPSTWTYYASVSLDWYRTGTNAICSGSYINGVGALSPDEYLIMGQQNIASGSTLSFWAAATDASYPADHFGVFVSDDGNSWTSVQEWTLTGKGGANGGRESRNGNGAKLGSWYNYTADLSSYAGQKYIAIRHFNCYDQYIMCVDDIELSAGKGVGVVSNRDMWDLLGTFEAPEGGHYGVVTDGEYIYTSNWGYSGAANNFYKYDMDGNMIEGFNISGCGTLRGMTFDGQYVYGVANSSTIYCVDLNNHTLVGTTTSAYGAMRGITYDSERDGFWVIGNWSGNLTLIDRTGAIVQAGPAPTSASDLAYYKDPEGVEHVFCFNNGTNDVDDYNIATNTITSAVFNFNSTPGYAGGSSGGCHVATYAGKTAFFGDIQQSPNLIAIYELDGEAPVPPTPVEGILGAILFRDGEFVGMFGANTTTYTEELETSGQFTYTIRVIYDGAPDDTYYAMSCGDDEIVTVSYDVPETDDVISSIYPNPTSGELHITATAMQHVTVFNTMGQVVFSSDVNTDSYVLNMGQLEAGVYMVKVDAAQGSSVKRIAVVK